MFETYKPLYQGQIIDSQSFPVVIYEPPANKDAIVSLISIYNQGTGSFAYSLGVVDGEPESPGIISVKESLIRNRDISAGAIDEIKGSICLTNGQKLVGFSDWDSIYVSVFGVEIE